MSCQVIDLFITNINNSHDNDTRDSSHCNDCDRKNDNDGQSSERNKINNQQMMIICAHDKNMLSFYNMEDDIKSSIGGGKIERSVQIGYGNINHGDHGVLKSYSNLRILHIAQVNSDRVFIECVGVRDEYNCNDTIDDDHNSTNSGEMLDRNKRREERSQLSYFILSVLIQPPSLSVSECYLHVEELNTESLSRRSAYNINSESNKKDDNSCALGNNVHNDYDIDGDGSYDSFIYLPKGCLIFESKLVVRFKHEDNKNDNNVINNNGDIDKNNTIKNNKNYTAFTLITYGKRGVKIYKDKRYPSESSTIMSQSTLKFNQLDKDNSNLFLALCEIPSFPEYEIFKDTNVEEKDHSRAGIAKQIKYPIENLPLEGRVLYVVHVEKGLLYSLPLSCHVIDIIPVNVNRTLVGHLSDVKGSGTIAATTVTTINTSNNGVAAFTPNAAASTTTTTIATPTPSHTTTAARSASRGSEGTGGVSQMESEVASDFDFYATQLDSQNSHNSCDYKKVHEKCKNPVTPLIEPEKRKTTTPMTEREIIPDSPYNRLPSLSPFDYNPFPPISSLSFGPSLHHKDIPDDGRCNNNKNGQIIGNQKININYENDSQNGNYDSMTTIESNHYSVLRNGTEFKSLKRKVNVINESDPPYPHGSISDPYTNPTPSPNPNPYTKPPLPHEAKKFRLQNDTGIDIHHDSYCHDNVHINDEKNIVSRSILNDKSKKSGSNKSTTNNVSDCNLIGDVWKFLGGCFFVSQQQQHHKNDNKPDIKNHDNNSYHSNNSNNKHNDCNNENDENNWNPINEINTEITFDYRLLLLHLSYDKKNNEYKKNQIGNLFIIPCPLNIIQPTLNLSSSSFSYPSSSTYFSEEHPSPSKEHSYPPKEHSSLISTSTTSAPSSSQTTTFLSSFHFNFEIQVSSGSDFKFQKIKQIMIHDCAKNKSIQNDTHSFKYTPRSSNCHVFCKRNFSDNSTRNNILGLTVISWSSGKGGGGDDHEDVIDQTRNLYDCNSKIT